MNGILQSDLLFQSLFVPETINDRMEYITDMKLCQLFLVYGLKFIHDLLFRFLCKEAYNNDDQK